MQARLNALLLKRWKALYLAFLVAASIGAVAIAAPGCGSTLPADTLGRFANTLEALKHSYLALCQGREEADECVHIREVVNGAIDRYAALNDSMKGEP